MRTCFVILLLALLGGMTAAVPLVSDGNTSEDSITVSVFLTDSLGNPADLAADSFFVQVIGPSGDSVTAMAGVASSLAIDSILVASIGPVYTYTAAASDVCDQYRYGVYEITFCARRNLPAYTNCSRVQIQYASRSIGSQLADAQLIVDSLRAVLDTLQDGAYGQVVNIGGIANHTASASALRSLLDGTGAPLYLTRLTVSPTAGDTGIVVRGSGHDTWSVYLARGMKIAKMGGAEPYGLFVTSGRDGGDPVLGTALLAMGHNGGYGFDISGTTVDVRANIDGDIYGNVELVDSVLQSVDIGAIAASKTAADYLADILTGTQRPVAARIPRADTSGFISFDGIYNLWAFDTSLIFSGIGALLKDTMAYRAAVNWLTEAGIADAVWDEDSTGHMTAGSMASMASQTSASGLDSSVIQRVNNRIVDSIWNAEQISYTNPGSFGYLLDRRISSLSLPSGSGVFPVTIVALDTVIAQVVPSARLAVYNDDYSALIASGAGDANGRAQFNLDAGSYKLTGFAPGYSFIPESEIIITGSQTDTLRGASFDPGQPLLPSMCRVYGFFYSFDGQPISGVTVTAELSGGASRFNSAIISPYQRSAVSDSLGYFYFDLLPSDDFSPHTRKYVVSAASPDGTILKKTVTVPDAASWLLEW